MKTILYTVTLVFLFAGCSPQKKELPDLDPAFEAVLEAHGDWEQFYRAQSMSYQMIHETTRNKETYLIDLDTRKTRIDASKFQIGFDGEQAWISPNRESFSGRSVLFYHNLYFYFFTIPYVLTDPGVTVKPVEDRTLNGVTYPTLAASFSQDKGASPEDEYYLLINPETGRLEYLLYTVTFFDNPEPSLSALKYEDYRSADGIFFPRILTGYTLEGEKTTSIRYQVSFADVLLIDEPMDQSIFEKPEKGVFAD